MNILNKKYITTMHDGSEWSIPVSLIALDRANYYSKEYNGNIEKSLNEDTVPFFEENYDEIEDWARNNINWSDVVKTAKCIKPPVDNYEDGWMNGEYRIM